MRSTILLSALLPALVAAEQKPLGWFEKAKAFIPSASSPSSKAASLLVNHVTYDNWRELLLAPSNKDVEEWMVLFTGNSTCFDRCENAEKAFNVSTQPIHPKRRN